MHSCHGAPAMTATFPVSLVPPHISPSPSCLPTALTLDFKSIFWVLYFQDKRLGSPRRSTEKFSISLPAILRPCPFHFSYFRLPLPLYSTLP